jgi:phosphate-selective porin OprO and OprP
MTEIDAEAGSEAIHAVRAALLGLRFGSVEPASFSGVRPKRPFDPAAGAWGAVELAGRVNGLTVDDTAFTLGFADATRSARKASAWAVGLNWYLNRNVKFVTTYERTTFEGGARSGDRPAENALFFRAQVYY